MTREEGSGPLSMLSANWPFLDFTDPAVYEVWMSALERYPVEEVRIGIKNAIAELKKTPSVAEILEYINNVRARRREDEREFNVHLAMQNAVKCRKCNDFGYVTIVYPNKADSVVACDCDAGHRFMGPKYWRTREQLDRENAKRPPETILMLFNGNRDEAADEVMKRYQLVKEQPRGKRPIVYKYIERGK